MPSKSLAFGDGFERHNDPGGNGFFCALADCGFSRRKIRTQKVGKFQHDFLDSFSEVIVAHAILLRQPDAAGKPLMELYPRIGNRPKLVKE